MSYPLCKGEDKRARDGDVRLTGSPLRGVVSIKQVRGI